LPQQNQANLTPHDEEIVEEDALNEENISEWNVSEYEVQEPPAQLLATPAVPQRAIPPPQQTQVNFIHNK
jgi:hypothetical protein